MMRLWLSIRRRLVAGQIEEARAAVVRSRDAADYLEQHRIPELEEQAAILNREIFEVDYPVKVQWGGSSLPERWINSRRNA